MKYALLVTLCMFITSCSNYQKPIVILPSDEAISECVISKPPELTGKDARDKLILASAWSLQTTNLGKCNEKLKTLQVWKRVNQERFGDGK